MWSSLLLKFCRLVCRVVGHNLGYKVIPATISHTYCRRCYATIDVRKHPRRAMGALGREFEDYINR